jgi:hypothetical protein
LLKALTFLEEYHGPVVHDHRDKISDMAWAATGLHPVNRRHHSVGCQRTFRELLRYLAAHRQHSDDHPDLSRGVLIQNSQNRDAAAMQAKLDEILRALDKARDQFVGIEHLSDRHIDQIREALERDIAAGPDEASAEHSVEELLQRH